MGWFDEIWNERDVEKFKQRFTEDAVCIGGARTRYEGKEAIAAYQAVTSRFSTDWAYETIKSLVDEDRYAVEWLLRGTHNADSDRMGPATGKEWAIRGASVGRRNDERIVEQADYWDTLGFMVAAGVIKLPPAIVGARRSWDRASFGETTIK
jgi:uncharacterized protein (TIGR02246 family)